MPMKKKRRKAKKSASPRQAKHPHSTLTQRAITSFNVAHPRLKILYFIPHLPQNLEEASPFGMYTPGLHASADLISRATQFPADVREPFTSPEIVLQFRLHRLLWRQIVPISIRALQQIAQAGPEQLFRVVLTNSAEVADAVDKLIFSDQIPFLHVSSEPGAGRVLSGSFDVVQMLVFVRTVLAHLSRSPELLPFVEATRSSMHAANRQAPRPVKLNTSEHNVTKPGELALLSYGYQLGNANPLVGHGAADVIGNPQPYIDRICLVADAVLGERRKLMMGLPAALKDWAYIITVPSIHWGHHRNWQHRREPNLAPDDKTGFKAAYKSVVQQTSYFHSFEVEDGSPLLRNKMFMGIVQSRWADQRCYTAGLTVLSAATLAPVLRLEPKVNQVRGDLNILGHCARSGGRIRAQSKLSRLAGVAGQRMRGLIDPKFLKRIDQYAAEPYIQGLKIVSDVPLEWMPCADVPLGMRYNLSRIPVMPGNVFISHCVAPPIVVNVKTLLDILVVRSFRPDDHLSPQLERAIDLVLENNAEARSKVRFVDVDTEDQLVDAISMFAGVVLIFDGHGDYENQLGIGTIVVGGQSIDVWRLRNRCQFPPIVIFSACDTHPLDGSHGSCANAAFALGATTVLATALPIDGGLAAVFIGRLMLRLFEFVPEAVGIYEILTWRDVISGMLRMSYTSEVTRLLIKHGKLEISEAGRDHIQLSANTAINARRVDWHEIYLSALSQESNIGVDDLSKLIALWASATDSLKYVQLGSPENIVIEQDPR